MHGSLPLPAMLRGLATACGADDLAGQSSTVAPLARPRPPPCARGDFILVGDLMKSLTLLVYRAAEGSLEVRARDLDSKWLTALAALDVDTYALSDNSSNLVCVFA